MRRAANNDKLLSDWSKVALFIDTSVVLSAALEMEDSEINYDTMLRAGVKPVNLITARLGPMCLMQRGFDSPDKLRTIGFDAGHMCDAAWCNEACLAHGRDELVKTFVISASDAVAVAGSESMYILRMTTQDLLERCAGFPEEARAVLLQVPRGISLKNVPSSVILDAGLRSQTLLECGYGFEAIVNQTSAGSRDLSKLGYLN